MIGGTFAGCRLQAVMLMSRSSVPMLSMLLFEQSKERGQVSEMRKASMFTGGMLPVDTAWHVERQEHMLPLLQPK